MEWSSRGGCWSLPSLTLAVLVASSVLTLTSAQCPWPRELSELNGSCLCAFNLQNELSIQCTAVNFTLLMTVLHQRALTVPLDLLYINNTRISVLNDRTFDGLAIENIQFSSCGIFNISTSAFQGLEDHLKNLNLQDNRLSSVPTESLEILNKLTLLDLSGNKLTNIPENAFKGSKLATLKLADNEISLSDRAFVGLETSLKNLNLKGTKLRTIPVAIRNLPVLAFLDLAQNQIRDIEKGSLANLHSLTALNLERNLLQSLEVQDFQGANDTLSSLSLLNNLITDFPREAFHTLSELRVLDIGFNLITSIPPDGFRGVRSLTLLALDGNPLSSVPGQAFTHLNTTLRGLSVGGRFLNCDCKVAWISDWIRDFDLQVTSRERNPQFCGSPPELRERSFYQLNTEELKCNQTDEVEKSSPVSTVTNAPPRSSSIITSTIASTTTTTTLPPPPPPPPRPSPRPSQRPSLRPALRPSLRPSPRPTLRPSPRPTTRPTTPVPTTTSKPRTTSFTPGTAVRSSDPNRSGSIGDSRSRGSVERPSLNLPPQLPPRAHQGGVQRNRPNDHSSAPKLPNLVRRNNEHSDDFFGAQAQGPFVDEVIVQDAYRKDNSVIIQWDSEVSNILGFRVVYRLFGDKAFKLGPPLAASEREFKIKNVPTQECIVVCVVSLEEVTVTPENVENSQCREIRTETSGASTHMDTIIIAASAAICGTVIIAVIVFICCNRKRVSRREKDGIPAVLSPGSPPLASLGTLGGGNLGNMGKGADWDTISMYSQRSIPRARMYHMDKGSTNQGFIPDDARSHISRQSSKHIPMPRSMADGQSQRSYSALSARNLAQAPAFGAGLQLSRPEFSARNMAQPAFGANLQLSRPDLRMSHQSLAASQFGSGTMGGFGLGYGMGMGLGVNQSALSRAASTRTDRTDRTDRSDRRRHRSKSREREQQRAGSRMSHAGSTHSLTGYDTDNWTDHDMDIYMARNPTKGGLVQL